MIAIVAHWMAEDYEVKSALLAIREVHGEYTGKNIMDVVYPVMKELVEYPAMVGITEEEKHEYVTKKWRSFGAVGKLHNIVKYIQGSP